MIEERGLPSSLPCERLILGSVLQDGEVLHDIRPLLSQEDFTTETHRRIWARVCELYDAGRPVDITIVFHAGEAHGDGIQGFYLADLIVDVPRLSHLHEHVRLLKDMTVRRKMMFALQHMTNRCLAGDESSQALLDAISKISVDLVPVDPGGGLQSAGELIDEVGLETLLAPRKDKGLMFPWHWMNQWTSGMLPSELWVLAGSTSAGKTSAMLQHAVAAARRGVGVAIFSLEVSMHALFQKACFQLARVDSEKHKQGFRMTSDEHAALQRAANELHEMPLYFDTQATTVAAIHAAIRRRRVKSRVDHVIVDYLQLLGNSGRHDTRAQAVGANAWALKILASDFQVPVLLLSQFSRPEKGVTRAPLLGDLKESGDIENHANGVWFIHRPDPVDSDPVSVEFLLPKQRDGRRNIGGKFLFFPKCQRFEEEAKDDD